MRNPLNMLRPWAVVILCALPAFAMAEAPAAPRALWFPVGETLTYRIYWGLVKVGSSEVKTEWVDYEGRTLISIQIRSRTSGVLGKIYRVEDFLESLIDPETFLPVRFIKKLREGRYRCDEVTHFDYEKGEANFYSNTKNRAKNYAINDEVRDLISFMYYVRGRAADFEVGRATQYKVMADEQIYDLYVKPIEEEPVKLPRYGDVNCLRLEPEAKFEGLFVRKGKLWVWVSDDDRRIVTKARAKIPVGSIKLVLSKVEGPGDDFWIKQSGERDDEGLEEDDD
jgi:hypothetical protein